MISTYRTVSAWLVLSAILLVPLAVFAAGFFGQGLENHSHSGPSDGGQTLTNTQLNNPTINSPTWQGPQTLTNPALINPTETTPVWTSYTFATLPAAGTAGRLARVTDNQRGLYFDNGSAWVPVSIFNVRLFGAKGDGTTDDTAAIQTAIAAAYHAAGQTVGGLAAVYVPIGTYNITGTGLTMRNSSATAGLIVYGDGPGNSILKLASGAGPLLDIGGPSDSATFTSVRELSLRTVGTQTAPVLRLVNADRVLLSRIFVFGGGAGTGTGPGTGPADIYIQASAVECYNCEAYNSLGNGVELNSAHDIHWYGGFVNNNDNYGLYCSSTLGTPSVFDGVHFEVNGSTASAVGGTIKNNGCNYLTVKNSSMQPNGPAGGNTNPVIETVGTALTGNGTAGPTGRFNAYVNNSFVLGGQDHISRTDSNGGGNINFCVLKFSAETMDNFHSNNLMDTRQGTDGPPALVVDTFANVCDLGRNYNGNTNGLQVRAFNQNEASGKSFGWLTTPQAGATNLLSYSEDLTNAAWVKTAVTSSAYVTSQNPYLPSGDKVTDITFNAAPSNGSLCQSVTVTIAAGQLYTFSAYSYNPNYPTSKADLRLRITDSTGSTFYAETDWRVKNAWVRVYTSFVNTTGGNIVNPQVCLAKVTRNSDSARLFFYGAQFNLGDLAPYLPALSAPSIAAHPGLVGMAITATKCLSIAQSLCFTSSPLANVNLNFGVSAAVPGCTDSAPQTFTGAILGSTIVNVSAGIALPANWTLSAFVSAANQVIVRWCQLAGAAADPDGGGGTSYYVVGLVQDGS